MKTILSISEFKEYAITHTVKEISVYFKINKQKTEELLREFKLRKHAEQRINCPVLLTEYQGYALIGNLLGDGSLSKITEKAKKSLFEISQKSDKSEYVELLFNIYKPFSKKINSQECIDSRSGKVFNKYRMRTVFHPIFTELEKKWYLRNDEGNYIYNALGHRIKIVPKDIKLNNISLATWVCDDGSNWDGRTFRLHTNGFSFEEVEFLINKLYVDFNIIGRVNRIKNKPVIVCCGDNAFNLMETVKNFVPNCFKYKTMNRLSKYNKGTLS
jgi:hypothetical protein